MKRATKIQQLHKAQSQIRIAIKTMRRVIKADGVRGRYAETILVERLDHLVADPRDIFNRDYSIAEWIDEIEKVQTK